MRIVSHEDDEEAFMMASIDDCSLCCLLSQVWLVSFPKDPQVKCLKKEEQIELNMASSSFFPGPALFHRAFPFHVVLDEDLAVLQLGSGMRRMVPGLEQGADVRQHLEAGPY